MSRVSVVVLLCLVAATAAGSAGACERPGRWWQPGGETLDGARTYAAWARADAVLLGERHDREEDHRWQLATLAQLHAHKPDMVLALEMLPRSAQAALDTWVAGESTEAEFLRDSGWYRHWGVDPALYLPILHFARLHRIPVRGVNLERHVVRRIGRAGYAAVPSEERAGVGPAAAPDPAYLERLHRAHAAHAQHGLGAGSRAAFVRAQLARDRAMAEGVAQARGSAAEAPLVVLLAGRGHMEAGHGVPGQLADLGIHRVPVLLPWPADRPCGEAPEGLATALFTVAADGRFQRAALALGLAGEDGPTGVAIARVAPGSVAEAAGLAPGDVIVAAAGQPVTTGAELRRIVHLQAPGSWLPLRVRTNGTERVRVVRFPAP